MSLTTDMSTLVARADALIQTFDTKEAQINAALAVALAAAPQIVHTLYVDQIAGKDTNDGRTAAAPLKSIEKAIALVGEGRHLHLALMSDYTVTAPRIYLPVGMLLRLNGYSSSVVKFHLGAHIRDNTDGLGNWEVGGFYAASWGFNSLNLDNIEVVFPVAPTTGTMTSNVYNALLGGNVQQGPPYIGLELVGCVLTMPSGGVGWLLGARTRAASLLIKTSTYTASAMAGKWIAGTASGTTPASVGWVLTNLTTL